MSLRPNNYEDAKANFKPLKRSPLRSRATPKRTAMKRSTKRLGAGKRMKQWARVWRWLKDELSKRGRTKCEFHFIAHQCWGALFPCHSRKRREMEGDDIYTVAMGCQQIARLLDEDLTHEEMEAAVMRAINENGGMILPSKTYEAAQKD